MKRIEYIDVCKGMLILLVLIHHIPQAGNWACGMDSLVLDYINGYSFIVCSFFMQAFFVVSGYCSSFSLPSP